MLDVQLGLRLWSQPVKLHRDQVVLSFAAPHSLSLRHEVGLLYRWHVTTTVFARPAACRPLTTS